MKRNRYGFNGAPFGGGERSLTCLNAIDGCATQRHADIAAGIPDTANNPLSRLAALLIHAMDAAVVTLLG